MTGDTPISGNLDTFPKLLAENARVRGDKPASREKDFGIWLSWTWGQVAEEVRAIACGLAALGVKRGDKVTICGDNRPHLYWSMTAVQALGAIPVPVYQDSVPDEMQYIYEHAEAKFAIVENQEQVDKLLEIRDRTPALEHIVYKFPRGMRNYDQPFLDLLADIEERGRAFDRENPDFYEDSVAQSTGADIAIMLYTSGTTGRPKGVMLSFDNLIITGRNG
ncbi:MAG TPA: long-chain fatty acid--CoA ligase, partial [Rhodospirillales bacterium]|nr:long-chain fatty acid--CoA ligase [Rhodospirillales bacterium]